MSEEASHPYRTPDPPREPRRQPWYLRLACALGRHDLYDSGEKYPCVPTLLYRNGQADVRCCRTCNARFAFLPFVDGEVGLMFVNYQWERIE